VLPGEATAGFVQGVDLRHAPTRDGAGSGVWLRRTLPVVAGEETAPTAEITTVVDFANLIGVSQPSSALTMINLDVTVEVLRAPGRSGRRSRRAGPGRARRASA